MRRLLGIRLNRHLFRVMLVAVALQFVLGFVLGWGFAAFIVCAGLVGYQAGANVGFKHGLDHSYASQLRGMLEGLTRVEEQMSGELAPDDPRRQMLAQAKADALEELRRVA